MNKKITKALYVASHPDSGHQIALLRELKDFKGFYDVDYIKQRYLKTDHDNDCVFRQNAPYINLKVHTDLICGVKIELTKVMDCSNEKEVAIAKKYKKAFNDLFKAQNKYYSTK